MTPQIDRLRKTSTVLRVWTHIYVISKEIDRKTFIFRVNLGMWHLKLIVLENGTLLWGISTHIYGVFEDIHGKTCSFLDVNLGMWPLKLDCLGKTSTVLRVSTDIYGVSKKIDGKTFICRVNLGMWPLKSIVLEKQALFWGFPHIYGVFEDIHGKMFIFRVNLGMWPLKLIVLENRALFWGFQLTFIGFLRREMGKHAFWE